MVGMEWMASDFLFALEVPDGNGKLVRGRRKQSGKSELNRQHSSWFRTSFGHWHLTYSIGPNLPQWIQPPPNRRRKLFRMGCISQMYNAEGRRVSQTCR